MPTGERELQMNNKDFTQTTISTQDAGRFVGRIYRVWLDGNISYAWEVLDTKHNVPYQERGFLTSAGAREARQQFWGKLAGVA